MGVAIIGILASVVLASLNTARSKGANAAIKANLANIRAQAELVYDPLGAYGTAANAVTGCAATGWTPTAGSLFADATIKAAIISATTSSGVAGCCNSTISSGSAWVASVQLKAAEGSGGSITHWCVDSTGVSAGKPAIASGTAC